MKKTLPPATWAMVKADYLTGRYSCQDLADMHKVSHDAVVKRCGREKWAATIASHNTAIEQTVSERVRKLSEELAHRRVDHIRKAVDVGARLLGKIEKRVETLRNDAPVQELRSLVGSFHQLLDASQTPLGITKERREPAERVTVSIIMADRRRDVDDSIPIDVTSAEGEP